jgi:hypothetical protein
MLVTVDFFDDFLSVIRIERVLFWLCTSLAGYAAPSCVVRCLPKAHGIVGHPTELVFNVRFNLLAALETLSVVRTV